jgi:hypothetical protein
MAELKMKERAKEKGEGTCCQNFETYFWDATLGPNGVMYDALLSRRLMAMLLSRITAQQSALDSGNKRQRRWAFNGAAEAYRGSSALAPLVKTAWGEKPFRL